MQVGKYEISATKEAPIFAKSYITKELGEEEKAEVLRHRRGFDDPRLKIYEFMRANGVEPREADQSELYNRFGSEKDPVGYREDGSNVAWIARNRGKKKLSGVEMAAIALHEYGHGITDSERKAQQIGIGLAEQLELPVVAEELRRQMRNMTRLNYN